MRLDRSTALLSALALVITLVPACKKTSQGVDTIPAVPTSTPAEIPKTTPKAGDDTDSFPPEETTVKEVDLDAAAVNRSGVLQTIYFDYDRSELRADARAALKTNSDWVRDHPKYRIIIEGHCDERGSIEYNLALGDRRASSVRDYMATLGIPASRIRAVSYGEERPAESGHTEAAWSRNRRAAFLVE